MTTAHRFRRFRIMVLATALTATLVPRALASPPTFDSPVAMFDTEAARWHLRYADGSVHTFTYGQPGDAGLLGDWDCDGLETVGVYSPSLGRVSIRNSNTAGPPAETFFFGVRGDAAVTGDWDGDGCDTIAIYRLSEGQFYFTDQLRTSTADLHFFYGVPGDEPLAGDFDGDGADGIGVYRPSNASVHLRETLSTGIAETQFYYGLFGDRPFTGDWNGDGIDTVAVFRPGSGSLFLSEANRAATASAPVSFGRAGWSPVSASTIAEPISSLNFRAELPPIPQDPSTTSTTGGAVPTTQVPTTTTAPGATTSTTTSVAPPATTTTTLAPTTTTTPPPPPPVTTGRYGTGYRQSWIRPNAASTRDVAYGPFVVPKSGRVDAIAFYYRHNGSYAEGTGGTYLYTLRSDNNGQPATDDLAHLTLTNPMATFFDESGRTTAFQTLDAAAAVTVGQRVWITAKNLHPDPTNNWAAHQGLAWVDSDGGYEVPLQWDAVGDGWERRIYQGPGWGSEGEGISPTVAFRYDDGTGFGQGYRETWSEYPWGSSTQKIRERFIPQTDMNYGHLSAWFGHASGSATVTAELYENDVLLLSVNGTAESTESIPMNSTAPYDYRNVGVWRFPMTGTLVAGREYRVEFSSSGSYDLRPMRRQPDWPAGTYFSDGWAEYFDGSSWGNFNDNRPDEFDLWFYFHTT